MKEEVIVLNGMQINYKIVGQGPAILILHGWGKGSDSYVKIIEGIARGGYQVVIPDLPGFGKSLPPKTVWGINEYADFVKRFSEELDLQKFALLGHSFGGQVAVKLAAEYPEKIQKLILYAAAAVRRHPGAKTKILQSIAKLGNALFSVFPLFFLRPYLRKAFYRFFGISDAAYSKGIMKEIRERMVRDDQSHLLFRIAAPALLLWGDKDVSTPLAEARLMKSLIPHAILTIFPGATHLLHQEMPEQFVESILLFLRLQH